MEFLCWLSRTWISIPRLPFSRGSAADFTALVNTLLPDVVLRRTGQSGTTDIP